MKRNRFLLLIIFSAFTAWSVAQDPQVPAFKSDINKQDITAVLKAVADWQVRTPLTHDPADWTNAALYAGMVEWAGIAGNDSYYEWLKGIC